MSNLNTARVDFMTSQSRRDPGSIFNAASMKIAMRTGSLELLRPVQQESGFAANAGAYGNLMTNASLRKDEWEALDDVVSKPRREELVGASDLISRGLTYMLTNPLGKLTLEWEAHGEVDPARTSMLMGTMPDYDQVDFDVQGMPIPIVSAGFKMDERYLMAGRNKGEAIDVTNADAATRQVNLKIDDMFFNGAAIQYGGFQIYGYTTHPQRTTGTLTAAWTTATGAQIYADVLAMVQGLYESKVTGPYVLYIPAQYHSFLDADFKAEGDKTIRQRILEIEGLEAIRTTFALTDEVVLAAMQRQTVDAVVGFMPTLVQWDDLGGAVSHFRVISIVLPRPKRDYDNTSGIVHYSAP